MPRDRSSRFNTSTRPEVVVIGCLPLVLRAACEVSPHDTGGRAGRNTARDACPRLSRRTIVPPERRQPAGDPFRKEETMQANATMTPITPRDSAESRIRALVRFNGLVFHSLAAASFLETAVPRQANRLLQA